MKYMEMMARDADFVSGLSKKLSPPLVTLVENILKYATTVSHKYFEN